MPSFAAARMTCLAGLLLPLIGAAPSPNSPPSLTPGAWRFTDTPTSATLDGRVLHDLPVGAITEETTCLTPELAARPATWLARDLIHDCTLDQTTVAAGRVAITGHCPPQGPGFAPGRLTITGRYTADSYDLAFATLSPDENGTMGFDGRMTGRRTGSCPANR